MNTRIILLAFSLLFSLPAAEAGQEWKTDKSDSVELVCSERAVSKVSRTHKAIHYFSFPRVVACVKAQRPIINSAAGITHDRTIAFRQLLI